LVLDTEIKEQLNQYLALLENDLELTLSLDQSENAEKMAAFVKELADLSPKLQVIKDDLAKTPSFGLAPVGEAPRVIFAGIPLGHEFNSLVLALLQVGGRAPKIDDVVKKQIAAIPGTIHFETYVSLTCHNCPDVVQALNIMSVLNPKISHTMIDGAFFQEEVENKEIMAVPAVFANGEFFASGRTSLEEMLQQISEEVDDKEAYDAKEPYEVLVVGGGPAGASAAIYAARKGIRTGLVADKFGGQVLETLGIENLIGTKYTEGPKLMAAVEEHVNEYDVDVMKLQQVTGIAKKELVEVTLANGAVLKSKTAVVATGARWRSIGVPGEQEFKTKGVAYCPHCDGPLFAGKKVAVVGGGNSGIEAAIDLAGVVEHVTVLEFLPELKADKVLQERLHSLPNVTVLTKVQTTEITGDTKVNGVTYQDRNTGAEHHLDLAGIFILIGLMPNTEWAQGSLELTPRGEIVVDKSGATSMDGVYAAGDCTDSLYKQIIISMGSGATAALGAFDYLIRH
jgi:alkyl hydroperoxide reductase, F subunit